MASPTDICNKALELLEEETITSIDDETSTALTCKVFYEDDKESLLQERPWTFAQWREQLAQDAQAPAFEFQYRYKLPQDFLYLNEIFNADRNDPYAIEGDYILLDLAECQIKYTRKVPEGMFSPLFINAFAPYLAWHLAGPVAGSNQRTKDMFALYKDAMNTAQNVDGLQKQSESLVSEGRLMRSRRRVTSG